MTISRPPARVPFSAALRALMDEHDITFRELSGRVRRLDPDEIGLSHPHLVNLAQGRQQPSERATTLIARAFDVDPTYFLETRVRAVVTRLDPRHSDVNALLAQLERLQPQSRDQVNDKPAVLGSDAAENVSRRAACENEQDKAERATAASPADRAPAGPVCAACGRALDPDLARRRGGHEPPTRRLRGPWRVGWARKSVVNDLARLPKRLVRAGLADIACSVILRLSVDENAPANGYLVTSCRRDIVETGFDLPASHRGSWTPADRSPEPRFKVIAERDHEDRMMLVWAIGATNPDQFEGLRLSATELADIRINHERTDEDIGDWAP